MNLSAPAARGVVFRKVNVHEAAVLAVVAWLVPFLVHLVPWSGERPLGAHLLPMFWATFVAAYFYGARVAVVVGSVAPAINLALTGLPALRFLGAMGCELVVFALVVAWAVRRWPRVVLLAPLGYLVARIVVTSVLAATGASGGAEAAVASLVRSATGGIAGLVVLAGINAALVWFYPKTGSEADEAAGV